ncbi:MAG: hypothetical protein ACQCN6_01680 [Candidatus Bathyarchaeia archaeon]|jgi:hypothetical protein
MNALVIFPSIRDTPNFARYAENFSRYKRSPDIMVLDEDGKHRKAVSAQFAEYGFTPEFYGVEERREWCKNHLGLDADLLIPQRSHDELSFGLLVALTRCYDMVVFIDDDTYPSSQDFLGEHWRHLSGCESEVKVNRLGTWVNTHPYMAARGFPYCERPGDFHFSGWRENCASVLNMGLWQGVPDLNAIDYLQLPVASKTPEGFNGFDQRAITDDRINDFHLCHGNYAPICSMNLAFKPEIIPAFYQLWENNRYNDIFSGIFLKRITDHLGKTLSVGNPLCFHEKAPRDLFRDAELEMRSVKLNETLWQAVSKIRLTSGSWLGCYRELAEGLNAAYRESEFSDLVYVLTRKMLLWCEVCTKLGAR